MGKEEKEIDVDEAELDGGPVTGTGGREDEDEAGREGSEKGIVTAVSSEDDEESNDGADVNEVECSTEEVDQDQGEEDGREEDEEEEEDEELLEVSGCESLLSFGRL